MVAVAQGSGCILPATASQLGTAGQTTTLSGGATYSGTYRVLGNLVLTNGTYNLMPGTIFYVDGNATRSGGFRRVRGSTITVGANASLVLDGATLTAAGSGVNCHMWRGVVVDNNGQGPGGTRCLIVRNNSTIRHAFCGIDMLTSATAYYSINEAAFAHNLIHVRDNAYHASGQASLIARSTFESDASSMHFPSEQTPAPANDTYYTYQALGCAVP